MPHDAFSPSDDFDGIIRTLEEQRPRLSPVELDELKRRTLRSSRTIPAPRTQGTFMRSRTAITTMLASGLLLSGGGTALGVTALQSANDASVAQYGTPGGTTGPSGPTGPSGSAGPGGTAPTLGGYTETPAGTNPTVETLPDTTPTESGGVKGERASGGTPSSPSAAAGQTAAGGVQATRQVNTFTGDSLPFTGYASIPVLLLGLALLGTGLVLHRRTA